MFGFQRYYQTLCQNLCASFPTHQSSTGFLAYPHTRQNFVVHVIFMLGTWLVCDVTKSWHYLLFCCCYFLLLWSWALTFLDNLLFRVSTYRAHFFCCGIFFFRVYSSVCLLRTSPCLLSPSASFSNSFFFFF